MESILEKIKRGSFNQFHGGIHPPEQKFLTTDKPIHQLNIPKQLIIPIRQHIGLPGELIVNIGDSVLKGQALTKSSNPMMLPVHAPTSGKILKIEQATIAHPSGLQEPCIFLEPDGEDTWRPRNICPDYQALEKLDIVNKIANAGISGMGGAGFPSHIKANTKAEIEFLIINAAECEPYITADDLLIREQSPAVVNGIKILQHLLNAKNILIGIEDNKPEATEALKAATSGINNLHVCSLPTKYPTGGEKQLIQVLTNKEVPSGVLPSSLGIVVQNVATCFAIAEAVIDDIPLIRRVVTVSGRGLKKPQNVWAALGTPISDLLNYCENQQADKKHIIMGGPMMGFSLPSTNVPVVKTTNCILAPSEEEIPNKNQEVECIRCGQCADVCPSQLLPQELQWSSKAKDHDQLNDLNLFDCIECGACAYVCPSHIPLVHYYRISKAEIRQQKLLDIKAEKAKQRFEARKARLERDKQARAEKNRLAAEARKARMNSGSAEANKEKSAVAAALARMKAKKSGQETTNNDTSPKSEEKSQVSAAIARAKAKKLAKENPDAQAPVTNELPDEKSQVAAAIARAKAKKLAKQSPAKTADKSTQEATNVDSTNKKSNVSAAVAKAKAKKLAREAKQAKQDATNADSDANSTINAVEQETNVQAPSAPEKNKKPNVSAAVAKAKAKKLAREAEQAKQDGVKIDSDANDISATDIKPSEVEEAKETNIKAANIQEASTQDVSTQKVNTQETKKKPNVSAAVAKAKAKKLAREAAQNDKNNALANTDDKKVDTNLAVEPKKELTKQEKIAAAVAKAKAKKQLSQISNDTPINTNKDDTLSADDLKKSVEDEKKLRIAAAVAKAKAKKQQQKESNK